MGKTVRHCFLSDKAIDAGCLKLQFVIQNTKLINNENEMPIETKQTETLLHKLNAKLTLTN